MRRTQFVVALSAALSLAAAAHSAHALPVTFTNFNPASNNQSRIGIVATAALNGAPLTSAPQFAPGGLNGQGSESTLYNESSSNTPSNMVTNLGLYSIGFQGGSHTSATNATGLLGNLQMTPAVGGATGTAPADYGVIFSSPQSIVIPPIDVTGLGIPGLTTLNLGTVTAINLNVALRDIVLDFTSPLIPMTGGGNYPMTFDSTQVDVHIAGTSDMSLTATLKQDNLTNFLATGAALVALQQGLAGQGIAINITTNILQLSYGVGIGFSTPLPSTAFDNTDASQGKVEHVGSNLRLTLPVKFDVDATTLPAPLNTLITAQFAMSGQIVGQRPFLAVPEPSSLGLAGLGIAGMLAAGWRRRGHGC